MAIEVKINSIPVPEYFNSTRMQEKGFVLGQDNEQKQRILLFSFSTMSPEGVPGSSYLCTMTSFCFFERTFSSLEDTEFPILRLFLVYGRRETHIHEQSPHYSPALGGPYLTVPVELHDALSLRSYTILI